MPKLTIVYFFLVMTTLTCCENKKLDSESYLKDVGRQKYYATDVVPQAYQNFYGKWRLERIVGGFSGQGAPADFAYLEVKRFGIYAVIDQNKIIESGRIKVETFDPGQSQYFQVVFVPDVAKAYVIFGEHDGYIVFDNGKMYIGQPCCDTFQRMFVKEGDEE